MIYLLSLGLMTLGIVGLIIYIIVHAHRGRRKHASLHKEIQEAEESIRRGFAILYKDITRELAFINSLNLAKEVTDEHKERERHLLRDLESIKQHIRKEIWDIEVAER
jgi:argininosuccinate lyase